METEKKMSLWKKVGLIFLILFLFFGGIIIYSQFIGPTGLIIKEYKIINKKIPQSFYGFKIAHISDLHYGRTIHKKDLKKIVETINKLKPDIVVLTGDLLDKEETISKEDIETITKQLKNIDVTINKFAISGNHDHETEQWSTIIKNSNFVNLNDTYELIYNGNEEPILLAGLSTNLKGDKKVKDKIQPIYDYITGTESNELTNMPQYKILLLHEPDFVKQIESNQFNLILAGHSHNGQVRLPFIGAIIKPVGAKIYYDEYYQLNQTDLYISSGLGTSTYDFRLWNRPSINFYRLTNK